ncbi:MAG: hypothetical protein ACOCUV_03975 [bacterium]
MSKTFSSLLLGVFLTFNTTFAYSANVTVKITVTKTADLEMPEINEIVSKVNTAIRANLSGSEAQIVENGTRFLANAIRPVWDSKSITQGKKKAADNLHKDSMYHKGHYIHHLAQPFLDFRPVSSTANKARLYCVNRDSTETVETNGYMLIDTLAFPKGEGSFDVTGYIATFKILGRTFNFGEYTERVFLFREKDYDKICNIVKSVDAVNYHSNSLNISEWDWVKNNGLFDLNSTSGLINRNSSHRIELFKNNEGATNSGKSMPSVHPLKNNTYCNLFAMDLSRDILFPGQFHASIHNDNSSPWGGNQRANIIHYRINKNADSTFVRVKKDISDSYNNPSGKNAWDFTEVGYVVYLTAFHKDMSMSYLNQPTEKALENAIRNAGYGSGHIATCYNAVDGTVVQAGNSTDVLKWNTAQTAHVYLGYILLLD